MHGKITNGQIIPQLCFSGCFPAEPGFLFGLVFFSWKSGRFQKLSPLPFTMAAGN